MEDAKKGTQSLSVEELKTKDQHYLSLNDANATVRLQPQWAKGYFRRAEVDAAGELYDEAILSYTRALQLEPDNPKIMESIKNITDIQKKKLKGKQNVIWSCTCIGFVVGIIIVVMDYTMTANPTLANPLSMVAFSIALAGLGWGIGITATSISSWSAGKSLQPPSDLVQNEESEKEASAPERKIKYSKAQARQRYKQGKH